MRFIKIISIIFIITVFVFSIDSDDSLFGPEVEVHHTNPSSLLKQIFERDSQIVDKVEETALPKITLQLNQRYKPFKDHFNEKRDNIIPEINNFLNDLFDIDFIKSSLYPTNLPECLVVTSEDGMIFKLAILPLHRCFRKTNDSELDNSQNFLTLLLIELAKNNNIGIKYLEIEGKRKIFMGKLGSTSTNIQLKIMNFKDMINKIKIGEDKIYTTTIFGEEYNNFYIQNKSNLFFDHEKDFLKSFVSEDRGDEILMQMTSFIKIIDTQLLTYLFNKRAINESRLRDNKRTLPFSFDQINNSAFRSEISREKEEVSDHNISKISNLSSPKSSQIIIRDSQITNSGQLLKNENKLPNSTILREDPDNISKQPKPVVSHRSFLIEDDEDHEEETSKKLMKHRTNKTFMTDSEGEKDSAKVLKSTDDNSKSIINDSHKDESTKHDNQPSSDIIHILIGIILATLILLSIAIIVKIIKILNSNF